MFDSWFIIFFSVWTTGYCRTQPDGWCRRIIGENTDCWWETIPKRAITGERDGWIASLLLYNILDRPKDHGDVCWSSMTKIRRKQTKCVNFEAAIVSKMALSWNWISTWVACCFQQSNSTLCQPKLKTFSWQRDIPWHCMNDIEVSFEISRDSKQIFAFLSTQSLLAALKCFTLAMASASPPEIIHYFQTSLTYPYLSPSWEPTGWFGCAASSVKQAGRDGRDGRDGFGCAPACVVQAGRDGQDGRDGFAVLQHVWYRLVGTVGTVGMVGMVRILLRAQKFRFYHSDSTIPISTTRFRFYHSDFDNTHLSICLSVHMSIYLPIDICMYVCMYVYIYIYLHIHIHSDTWVLWPRQTWHDHDAVPPFCAGRRQGLCCIFLSIPLQFPRSHLAALVTKDKLQQGAARKVCPESRVWRSKK